MVDTRKMATLNQVNIITEGSRIMDLDIISCLSSSSYVWIYDDRLTAHVETDILLHCGDGPVMSSPDPTLSRDCNLLVTAPERNTFTRYVHSLDGRAHIPLVARVTITIVSSQGRRTQNFLICIHK